MLFVPGPLGTLEIALIALILVVIVLAKTAYWIYTDAKQRDSPHAVVWGLGAFFGGILVWALYFIVRDKNKPTNNES
jgi:hypothetical protein